MTCSVLPNVIGPTTKRRQAFLSQRQQVALRRLLLSQHTVEHLFQCPGTLAKLGEADHARTALERVKRTAQGGELLQIAGVFPQQVHRFEACGHHFAGLLQEDVQQVVFIV